MEELFMKQNWIYAVGLIVAMIATTSFAHLPSPNDARFGIMRERMRMSAIQNELAEGREGRNVITYAFRNEWSPVVTYNGDYANFRGDTVQWGEWNDGGVMRPLFWWAKFWSRGDEPGELGTGGGTSPWVMINSISASSSPRGTPTPPAQQWRGWTPSMPAPTQPIVATWRYGAAGAYAFTHDDIGPMPFEKAILPAMDLGEEADFHEIKQAWGIFVRAMSDADWNNAIRMVKLGHELFNHSYDHTSAADQYQWFYPGQTVPTFDPSIPYAIRGLRVSGLWGDPSWGAPWLGEWAAGQRNPNLQRTTRLTHCDPDWPQAVIDILTLENDGIRVRGPAYWTGMGFATDACVRALEPMVITPLGNTQRITLPSGMEVFVNYTRRDPRINADGTPGPDLPTDGSLDDVVNEGRIFATTVAWFDLNQLATHGAASAAAGDQRGNLWNANTRFTGMEMTGGVREDQGHPAMLASIFTVAAWQDRGPNSGDGFTRNMRDANNIINERLFNQITNPGRHFAVGATSEFYGYPFDAYSTASHRRLQQYGILQARGGAKTPVPMLPDFFHPYAIDFDAFWIDRPDWTPARRSDQNAQGGPLPQDADPVWVFPGNAHVWLGLNEMVTEIVRTRGFMIREFHSVGDIADNRWFLDAQGRSGQPSNTWVLNSPAAQEGGWWGGITKNQLRLHYQYMRTHMDTNGLVVFVPSQAVKHRLTANATTNPQVNWNDGVGTLSVDFAANRVNPRQTEEISIILTLPQSVAQLDVEYVNPPTVQAASGTSVTLQRPRLAPRNLGSRQNGAATGPSNIWSVQFNPAHGNVRLTLNQPFVEQPWIGPDVPNWELDGDGCDWWDPECQPGSITRVAQRRATAVAFTGIQNGQINLRLSTGNYTVQLFNVQGRMISSVNVNAVNGVNATGLRTDHLARGMFILQVRDARGVQVLQHKLMLR
jgi:hypothetical protein